MIEANRIKTTLVEIVDKYNENGLLSDAFNKEFASLFDKDVLRIGIIGKMKAGKSSLVNALIFGNRVLPVGDKPVTVTLTEISFGEKESVEVELMTEEEIESLKTLASFDKNDKKANCAREIIEQIEHIEGGYQQYVDQNKMSISLNELPEYVADGGKLSGLAKIVRINLNDKKLQGISIVDTPGFNDPIESRGETTKNAIKNCQILLFVHDYYDRYDDDEVAMASEQIQYAGAAEVIDIVNKIDREKDAIIDDWIDIAEDYEHNRSEILQKYPDLNELLGSSKVICVSSYMSLLGQLDENNLDDWDIRHYNEFRGRFEQLKGKTDFYQYSGIPVVEKEINRISSEKGRYLIEAPVLKLLGELASTRRKLEDDIAEGKRRLASLDKNHSQYANDVQNIQILIDNVRDRFTDLSQLSSKIQEIINEGRDIIYDRRKNTAKEEFTEERFPEPEVFTVGVKKQNLSTYSLILDHMDDLLRNQIRNMQSKLSTAARSFVEHLINDTLTGNNVHVTEEQKKVVETPLLSSIKDIIDSQNITVQTDRPTSFPTGKMNQKTLYMNAFMEAYSDDRIQNDFLSEFVMMKEQVSATCRDEANIKLDELLRRLLKELHYSPSEKEKAMSELKDEISDMENQLTELDFDIQQLNNFKK